MVDAALIFGLSGDVRSDLSSVFRRFAEIQQVRIFGSRASGHYSSGSDIDLAVLAPTMTTDRFTQLWNDIDALPLVFKIDLLHWDTLENPVLKEKIMSEGLLFYAR
jgi:proline iminopeptidase